MGDATATIASESSAEVVNDNRADQHEILVKKGSGEVTPRRADDSSGELHQGRFQPAISKGMVKIQGIAAADPDFTRQPDAERFRGPGAKAVVFSWSPVDNVKEYQLRINRNPSFPAARVDDKKAATQVTGYEFTGRRSVLLAGAVRSGRTGKESIESETYRFTIVPEGTGSLAPKWTIFVQHGARD